jgi:hypothetical protein
MFEKIRTSFMGRIVVFILLLVMGAIFKNGIFDNIAWVLYGLSLIVFPCWPKAWDHWDHKKLTLGSRIAGVLAVVIGLITRFGV